MEPKVTFIIAHHNYQEYLPNAIQSALNQTYKNIHICVIDDCSNDQKSVLKIFENFVGQETYDRESTDFGFIRRSSNITYIQLPNRALGPSNARNIGIEVCWNNTDIFAILDADDENYPTKIEHCVEVLQSDDKIGVVYTDHNTLNTITENVVREYREPYDYFRLLQECIVHSGSVIKKEALELSKDEYGYYDITMRTCEDYDLWLRIAEHFLFYHIPEPLSLVRVQPKNSTDTVNKNIWNQNYQRVFQKRAQRLQ